MLKCGDVVATDEEYAFTWPGKAQLRQLFRRFDEDHNEVISIEVRSLIVVVVVIVDGLCCCCRSSAICSTSCANGVSPLKV